METIALAIGWLSLAVAFSLGGGAGNLLWQRRPWLGCLAFAGACGIGWVGLGIVLTGDATSVFRAIVLRMGQ
jgi:hypothetical protein